MHDQGRELAQLHRVDVVEISLLLADFVLVDALWVLLVDRIYRCHLPEVGVQMVGESLCVGVSDVEHLALSLALLVDDGSQAVGVGDEHVTVALFGRNKARSFESVHCLAIVLLVSISVFHLYEVEIMLRFKLFQPN